MTLREQGRDAGLGQDNDAQLSNAQGVDPDQAPLSELEDVTFVSGDSFLNDLQDLQRILKAVPIHLPKDGTYAIQLRKGELHIYESEDGVENYSLVNAGRKITGISENGYVTTIKVKIAHGEEVVIRLHRSPADFKKVVKSSEDTDTSTHQESPEIYSTPRRTSPWRSSSQRSQAPSESRGGGSGER